jgi:hypothetical protein
MKLTLFHSSKEALDRFSGPLHIGTREQATMRRASYLHEIEVDVGKTRRMRDNGQLESEHAKLREAIRKGFDSIVYLNRYEGMSTERIEALATTGHLSRLDQMSDAEFRKHVPEAQDSFIILEPEYRCKVVSVVDLSLEKEDAPAVPGFR